MHVSLTPSAFDVAPLDGGVASPLDAGPSSEDAEPMDAALPDGSDLDAAGQLEGDFLDV